MKKLISAVLLSTSLVFGLQFGSLGPQAFGTAGGGVAAKSNAFSPYFNPALIAIDERVFRIGVSVDVGQKNENFHLLTQIDYREASIPDFLKLVDFTKSSYISIESLTGAYVTIRGPIGAVAFGSTMNIQSIGKAKVEQIAVNNFIPGQNIPFKASFTLDSYILLEAPITYAYAFDLYGNGVLAVGVTGKLLSLSPIRNTFELSKDLSTSNIVNSSIKSKIDLNNKQYSVDLGGVYEWKNVRLGVVGKYLNSPKFNLSDGESITIDPQVRVGAAVDVLSFLTLSVDYDLTKNKSLVLNNYQEQMLIVGTTLDFYFAALRTGVAMDTINNFKLTYGVGLSLGVFDLGFQWSPETQKIDKYNLPQYWKFNFGFGFSL